MGNSIDNLIESANKLSATGIPIYFKLEPKSVLMLGGALLLAIGIPVVTLALLKNRKLA